MLHLRTHSAPARWVWGEERQTASTSLRGPEHPSHQTARAVGQPRDTAGKGILWGRSQNHKLPLGTHRGVWQPPGTAQQLLNTFAHTGLPARSFSLNLGGTGILIVRKAASIFFYTWQAKYFPSPTLPASGSTDTH